MTITIAPWGIFLAGMVAGAAVMAIIFMAFAMSFGKSS